MDNIIGVMEQSLREILNKALEMGMEYGKVGWKGIRTIKDIICLIKSTAMEYITGETDMFIKDFGWMIFVTEKDSFSLITKYNIMDTGRMEKE